LITSVIRGSSADSAGLRPGDVIVEYFGAPVTAADDVLTRASSAAPGVGARVIVIRDGRPQAMNVTVEPLLRPKSLRPHHASEDPLRFGLRLGDLDTRQRARAEGSIVEHVEDGSVAEMAGIEAGDIICKINQHMVRTAAEAIGELQHLQLGRTVFLLIWRDGEERIVEMNTE
jgi:serine protease Do